MAEQQQHILDVTVNLLFDQANRQAEQFRQQQAAEPVNFGGGRRATPGPGFSSIAEQAAAQRALNQVADARQRYGTTQALPDPFIRPLFDRAGNDLARRDSLSASYDTFSNRVPAEAGGANRGRTIVSRLPPLELDVRPVERAVERAKRQVEDLRSRVAAPLLLGGGDADEARAAQPGARRFVQSRVIGANTPSVQQQLVQMGFPPTGAGGAGVPPTGGLPVPSGFQQPPGGGAILPPPGPPPTGPLPQPPSPRQGSVRNFLYRGLALAAAREGVRALEAARDYNIDYTLAGGNQDRQLDATLQYRQRLTSGFIGGALGLLQDPQGVDELNLRATRQSTTVQEAAQIGIAERARFAGALNDRARIAALGNSFEAQREAARAASRPALEAVQEQRRLGTATIERQVEAERARLAAVREERFAASGFGDNNADVGRAAAARAQAKVDEDRVAAFRSALQQGQDRTIVRPGNNAVNSIEAAAIREVDRQERLARLGLTTDTAVTRLRGQNLPINAQISQIIGNTAQEVLSAPTELRGATARKGLAELASFLADVGREFSNRQFDAKTRRNVIEALIARDPERAQREATEGQREQALRAIPRFNIAGIDIFSPLRAAVNQQFDAQRQLEDQRAGDIRESLVGRTRVTQDLLNRRPLSAQLDAINIRETEALRTAGENADVVRSGAETERALARQQFADQQALTQTALAGRRRQLERGLARDPFGAQIQSTLTAGSLERQQFEQSGQLVNAALSGRNTELALRLQRREYLEGFQATQIDPRSFGAMFSPRDREDPHAVLQSFKDALREVSVGIAKDVVAQFTPLLP